VSIRVTFFVEMQYFRIFHIDTEWACSGR